MGPSLRCFLCNRKRGISTCLHRIPVNPNIRPAWLAFCKLNESIDDVSKVSICSSHFSPTDYIEPRARELGNRMKLKPDSIPSILKPHCSSVATLMDTESILSAAPGPSRLSRSPLRELKVESTEVGSCSTQVEHVTTPKRPRFSEPRYVGEVGTPHLATPRRAKRSFNLAKTTIARQKEKIITLQQQNRRLKKRIENLEMLIDAILVDTCQMSS